MKWMCAILLFLGIILGLWLYIDHRENDCLSAGICPKGYQFNSCDWKGCVVDEDSCHGRGRWDKKQEICFFNVSVSSGFEKESYDLVKESQFANGLAMIKDSYGKRLNSKQDEENYNDEKWHYFHEGLRNRDISQMVEHVNRPQVAPGRNDWARKSLKEIPTVDGWHFKD